MINKINSWSTVEEFILLFYGFGLWIWHLFGHLFIHGVTYPMFYINGGLFLTLYMLTKTFWAIIIDKSLSK